MRSLSRPSRTVYACAMINALMFAAALAASPEASGDAVFEVRDPQYEACVAGVRDDADAVRKRAERWLRDGGGAAALHCQAIGDLAAGLSSLAAGRLEDLAELADAGDDLVRARVLSQAAFAWLDAGEPQNAEAAVKRAFAYAPEGGELYITKGIVAVANEHYQDAINAITNAESEGFRSAAGFVARGRARVALAEYLVAADDVVAALALDPFNVDALVVRGELYRHGVEIDAFYTDTSQ